MLRFLRVFALGGNVRMYEMNVRLKTNIITFKVDVLRDTHSILAQEFESSFPGLLGREQVQTFFRLYTPKKIGRFVVYRAS